MNVRPGETGNSASAARDDGMSTTKLGGRSTFGSFNAVNDRRARLVNNIVVAGAFLFVSAVVFGLVG
jgi:hypothetical protein